MDVSCPQCDTLYEVDDRDVHTRKGVTLQCSECEHLFRLQGASGPRDERQRRWMVRSKDTGDILYFTTFETLHEWIMEGRVEPRDAISRTGNSWKSLHEMGEFAPIFQVVASIADLAEDASGESTQASAPGESERTPPPSTRSLSSAKSTPSTSSGAPSASTDPGGRTDPRRDEQSGPKSGKRQRQSTDLQFQGQATSEATTRPPADSKSSSTPKRQPQAESTDPPNPGPRSAKDGEHGGQPTESRSPDGDKPQKSSPKPRLRDERLRQSRHDDETNKSEQNPTLGQLEGVDAEHDDYEDVDIDIQAVQRRRWPAVVVVVAIATAAVGIWQRDAVQEWVGSAGFVSEQAADDSEADEPRDESAASLAEANQQLALAVDDARHAARAVETGEAVAMARPHIAEARKAADEEAGEDSAPSASELIAAGKRSINRGNTRQAVERFEAALDLSPDHPEALLGLANARLGAGQMARAVDKFETVRRVDPSMGEALIGIGSAERGRGRHRRALEAYEQYLEEFPDGPQVSIAEFQSEQLRDTLGEE